MRISFTGTRRGMTALQCRLVEDWLIAQPLIVSASHGMCQGADEDFHAIVRQIFHTSVFIAGFPSTSTTRSRKDLDCDWIAEPKAPLSRNRDIVKAGPDVLLATPCEMHELVRSGTWHAIRYAIKKKVRVEIFWPREKEEKKCSST